MSALAPGCYQHHRLGDAPDASVVDAAEDAPADVVVDAPMDTDRRPPDVLFRCDDGSLPISDSDVDLLFVIDDSPSMSPKQARLAAELPRLVDSLAFGDLDFDGTQDFPVPRSLLVSSVTSSSSRLTTLPDGSTTFEFRPGRDERTALADAASAFVRRGSSGNTIEQPLAMMAEAIEGPFWRPGAMLVVVLLSDEDDCSDSGCWETSPCRRAMFDVPGCDYPSMEFLGLEERVARWAVATEDRPAFLGIVAGLPPDLLGDGLGRVLADPRMQAGDGVVEASCLLPGIGGGFPPRRLATFADMLGESANLESICTPEFNNVLGPLLARLAGELVREGCE